MNRARFLPKPDVALLAVLHLIAASILLVCPAHALDPHKSITQYVQTSWSSETGLPENSVHAITQSANGYLWIGTEEGLTRFDGVRFVTLTVHNSPGLASNLINVLAPSRDGTVWVGTDSGLSHFLPSSTAQHGGTFVRFTTKDGLADNNITALCEDRDGALWVGTSQGLNRVVDGRVENWTTGHGLADPSVSAIAVDAGGTLWVGTANGLSRFEDAQFTTLTTRDGLPGNAITALAPAADGSLWAGTTANGIAQIRSDGISVPRQPLPWKEIAALRVDGDGALWIAFDRHGLARLFQNKLELYGVSRGLPSNLCTHALFEDREGSLWLGLLDAGAVQFRDGRFTVFGTSEGLSGNYVGEVIQAPDGSMFVGADINGVDRLYPDGHVDLLNHQGLPNEAVYSLLVSRDGSLWVGYRHGTLARLDHGHVSVYRDPQALDASLDSLFEDRDGKIWVGFNPQGLAVFDHGEFRHVTSTGIIRCITQASDGSLWLATDGDGLQRLFHGVITRYTTADGLPGDHVMYVYADPQGSVWAGIASGGLSRLRDGRIVSWTPERGLPDTTIGSILEDNFGNLWMGGDNGIFRIAKEELNRTADQPGASVHAIVYSHAAGLRISETLFGSMPCAWKARDGRLWFATTGGVAVVDPARMELNNAPPHVLIERAAFRSVAVPLRDDIHVGPRPGSLDVSFTAPTFVAPQLVRFRYRLDGLDPDWVIADARSARYANLSPGHYTFAVEAQSSDGVWSPPDASFSFVVRPPLTATPFAYVGYGLLVLFLAWGIVALRTRSLILRQWELTRVVAERTAQLEAEKNALELARRELHIQATHDSLTGLANRPAILEHLQREVARAIRDQQPMGVILADLDEFKNVNDNYGHLCGDDILRETAVRLRGATRGYDLVGRYGGEEFLILFPGWDLAVAPTRVDDLLNAIRSRNFPVAGGEVHLTCSFGVATFRPDVDPPDVWEILRRADTALYVAKNSGRNTASFEVRPA
ncbi:MAG TPA: two-component regulator propeller domain-containing protein [Acidobacteriaceae bacterium]|jgi:diguanylate cyclase (GGDEF)-like protein|nr:two-component regulator propeller domain-containing protein [Acidobacteriaceae bacterium]